VFAIVFIVFVFGSINAYLIWKDVQKSLERESEKRTLNLGKTIAEHAINPLLYEDYVNVQKLLDDSKRLDSSVVYAFILSEDKNIIASTYHSKIPGALININTLQPDDSVSVVLLKLKNENNLIIRDIAIPILSGKLGVVRIGVSEEGIFADVVKTVSHFWIMVGVFLLVGIIGAFLFAIFITNPINKIREVSDNLSFDALKNRTVTIIKIRQKLFGKINFLFRAIDEIDLLTDKFNEMISRLEEAYENLELAQHRLVHSEKLATIGIISSGLAHEINNPIAGVKSCLRRIENNPGKVEQNLQYVILIAEAIDRIEKVIKGLLNYARKEELVFRAVDVRDVIERVLVLTGHNLEKAQITLTKEIGTDINYFNGSLTHIEQILMNLLLNAIDTITEKNSDDKKHIKITANNHNDFIKVSVEDSGVGIPNDKLKKIFEPFFTTKIEDKGTGLGLPVILRIVEEHSGKIELESKVGEGSKFIIYLPMLKRSKD
jgi:two-component system, NtrC family, sensor kinase